MDPSWGGPVAGVTSLAAQAVAAGHSVQITCMDTPESPWLQASEVVVNALGPAKYGDFGYCRRLDIWLADKIDQFDAVITEGIWMYYSSAVRRAALRANRPYFVFTHGALDPWFKQHYPLKQIKKHVYWSFFEHKVLRDAAAVLFTTEEERVVSQGAFWPYRCNS